MAQRMIYGYLPLSTSLISRSNTTDPDASNGSSTSTSGSKFGNAIGVSNGVVQGIRRGGGSTTASNPGATPVSPQINNDPENPWVDGGVS
jgi:hypothetical protein